jgi:hypothetical protein
MSYAQFGTIAASDFNTLVGSNPVTTSNTLNTVWATGGTAAGYGQSAVPTVSVGGTVAASDWANLVNKTSNSASHQGSSITAVTAPSTGGTVTYLSAIPTNLATVYTNKLNATSQGATSSNTATYGSAWSTGLTFTHTVTFANGDAARYFFNSGGQLKVTVSHPTGTNMNLLLNNLCSNVGTVVLSAPSSGTAVIGGVTYNGVTKIGGGGNAPTISQNSGYFAQTTTNVTCFTQTASTGPSSYLATNIKVLTKTNGTQGTNGDTGSVYTIYTTWNEVPTGMSATSGSATTLTLVPPETTYIANTWGAITIAGTVTGA